jgi:hypothetical protein
MTPKSPLLAGIADAFFKSQTIAATTLFPFPFPSTNKVELSALIGNPVHLRRESLRTALKGDQDDRTVLSVRTKSSNSM